MVGMITWADKTIMTYWWFFMRAIKPAQVKEDLFSTKGGQD